MYKRKANKGYEKKDGLMIPLNYWEDWLPSEMRTEAQKHLKHQNIFKVRSRLATQLKLETQRQQYPQQESSYTKTGTDPGQRAGVHPGGGKAPCKTKDSKPE